MGSGCICTKKSNSSHSNIHTIPPTHPLSNISPEDKQKAENWAAYLKQFEYFQNPLIRFYKEHPGKFKKLTIEGPPSDMRWEVWKTLFMYKDQPIPSDQISLEFQSLIDKDLERTFPGHPFFTSQCHLQSLKELLTNIVRLNPDLGYCQGMNSVAGVFLLVSSNNIKESTLLFHIFIHKYDGKGLFDSNFPKVLELLESFNKLFRARIPSLYDHFHNIELDDHLWITKWFMTLFSYSFKLEAVIRFWDTIFVHGLGSMANIAVGILNYLRKEFESKDLASLLEYFPRLRSVDLKFDNIVANSCRAMTSVVKLENFWKERGMEGKDLKIKIKENEKIRIQLERSPEITEFSGRAQDFEGRKRANSLIIQHSPRSACSN